MPGSQPVTTSTASDINVAKQLAVEARIANEKKSLLVAYLLWLFLFPIGIQNFYVGRTKTGVLELVLAIVLVPLFLLALVSALAGDTSDTAQAVATSTFVLLVLMGCCWLWDLFTLPFAVHKHANKLREKLYRDYGIVEKEIHHFTPPEIREHEPQMSSQSIPQSQPQAQAPQRRMPPAYNRDE